MSISIYIFTYCCIYCLLFQVNREYHHKCFLMQNPVFTNTLQYRFKPIENDKVRRNLMKVFISRLIEQITVLNISCLYKCIAVSQAMIKPMCCIHNHILYCCVTAKAHVEGSVTQRRKSIFREYEIFGIKMFGKTWAFQ